MKLYDYLILGTRLYGSAFAYKAKHQGKKYLAIDKRSHSDVMFCMKIQKE
jgi:UDP-galactopyranose mutase